jgi:hypothetical protein
MSPRCNASESSWLASSPGHYLAAGGTVSFQKTKINGAGVPGDSLPDSQKHLHLC